MTRALSGVLILAALAGPSGVASSNAVRLELLP